MTNIDWVKEFPGGIVISDAQGIIVDMNDVDEQAFADLGGRKLIGTHLIDCHNDYSNHIIQEMIDMKRNNIYTVEKQGEKELVVQTPWYKNGEYAGLIEITLPLSGDIPHIKR